MHEVANLTRLSAGYQIRQDQLNLRADYSGLSASINCLRASTKMPNDAAQQHIFALEHEQLKN